MKLAVALQERNDLNQKIAQLKYRLELNAVVQEGEKTAENPEELLEELNKCYKKLEVLIARINKTNCTHQLSTFTFHIPTITETENLTKLIIY